MRDYNTNGNLPNDPLSGQNDDSFFGQGVLGTLDNILGEVLFGDGNFSSNAAAELSGYNAQQREFEQQEYLLEKEQAWNSEAAKMARAKQAGINPLTAAGAIAGSNSSASAPAVSNATGAPAAGLQAGVAGLNAGVAAGQAGVNASIGLAKIAPEIVNMMADTKEKLSKKGLNDEEARNFSLLNTYLPDEKKWSIAGLQQQFLLFGAQFDAYYKEMDYKDALMKEIDAKILEYKASASLMDLQKMVEQKRGLLLDQQTFELSWQNNMRQILNIDPNNSLENNLFLLKCFNSPLVSDAIKTINEVNYNRYLGQYQAESEFVYKIENARQTAKSLNEIITDWSKPASSMWEVIDKFFNASNGSGYNAKIDNPIAAKSNPQVYDMYCAATMSLNFMLHDIEAEIAAAMSANEMSKVANLSKRRQALLDYIDSFTFDEYCKRLYNK